MIITPAELTKEEGVSLAISEMPTCTSSSEGGVADHYVWRKDGVQVGSEATLSLSSEADRSDAGIYECFAFNDAGSNTAEFTYIVNCKIAIQFISYFIFPIDLEISGEPFESYMVTYGQNIKLSCIAVGFPEPTVSWMFSGTIQNHAVYTKDGLILHSVALSDSGVYTCTAVNVVSDVNKQIGVTVTGMKKRLIGLEYKFALHRCSVYFKH